jgi:polyphosphate kinase 2 (PPK2 family)
MILKPIRSGTALSLSDREARRPPDLQDREALKRMLADEVKELGKLQDRLWAEKRHAVLVILQGRDASGKDGAIKHVFDGCNPQGCRVTSFGVPTALELSHDFPGASMRPCHRAELSESSTDRITRTSSRCA